MRMRKKKNLYKRFSDCSDYRLCKIFHKSPSPEIKFSEIFNNDFPVWLEIGCGKGGFINQAAKIYKDINFLAVEKIENVAVTAMENSALEKIANIRYIIGLAENLERVIPSNSIEKIFLNFSCPFPKSKHEKRRLTHKQYLEIYRRILTSNGVISFKTDNSDFFEYSVERFRENNFLLKNITRDLHNSDIKGNIITEYESFFTDKGFKTNYLEAFLE